MEMMATSNKWKYWGSGFTKKDSMEYQLYVLNQSLNSDDDNTRVIYYFGGDECTMVKFINPINQLDSTIKEMNTKFTPQGKNIWHDYYKKSKYVLVLTEGSKTFEVYEVELVSPIGMK
jgi:hypothetical protein